MKRASLAFFFELAHFFLSNELTLFSCVQSYALVTILSMFRDMKRVVVQAYKSRKRQKDYNLNTQPSWVLFMRMRAPKNSNT